MYMSELTFNVNWDYRCPFARIVNEHIVAGLQNGANWNVEFLPFSLTEVHTEEGETPSWEDPSKADELLAIQVGIVAQKNFPDKFLDLHNKLFSLRHSEGKDLRSRKVLEEAIIESGIDASSIFAEIESGWPLKEFRAQHEDSVAKYSTFGVPTIFVDDKAAFVRLLTRYNGDPQESIKQIERIVVQISTHPEINELKHTTIPY